MTSFNSYHAIFYSLNFKLLVVSDSSTKIARLWFFGRSDSTFDIFYITSQFISFVVMVNDVKLQVVGVLWCNYLHYSSLFVVYSC